MGMSEGLKYLAVVQIDTPVLSISEKLSQSARERWNIKQVP
jgi:hypothetical protein